MVNLVPLLVVCNPSGGYPMLASELLLFTVLCTIVDLVLDLLTLSI